MQRTLAILLLCLSAAAARAQCKIITIPFHDVHGRMMIDTKIDGRAARLLVDTGSQKSIELHLYRRIAPVIRGNSLEFDTEGESLDVLMARPEEKFDGILGIDTVKHYHTLRIDYGRHVIELGD